MSAGKPNTQVEFEIYANATDLNHAAVSLTGFPGTDNHSFTWELGSENPRDRFAFYFRLRVFQLSPKGCCAIELRFNNNQKPPDQKIVEFCIKAPLADFDRLGAMFTTFSRLEDLTMEWTVSSAE
ncbi:hypothetical protein [Adhaeretor mobilis]|uniref:hypothetical protein n=1 Tax=Adhaeretor mobilis TaxID=1930276 RepID=UPI0011A6B730|nr:hypothetical protein [Adhaeretor mobilis]